MPDQHIEAVFENGVFRPLQPVHLPEHQRVTLTLPAGAADRELPIADFMEPVEYAWTEAGFETRQALKRYTEETHADY